MDGQLGPKELDRTKWLLLSVTSPQLLYNIKKKIFETSLDNFKKLLTFIIIMNVKSGEKTQYNNKKARDLDLENWDTHFDSNTVCFNSMVWFFHL